jgi:ketosteroid isomerase-like protein
MSRRMVIAQMYEKALFAGDRAEVARLFHEEILYWVAGAPPIGGEWRGREQVLDALWNRETGLGAADWGYEDVWREWYEGDEPFQGSRVMVEIRERSWLKSDPKDVMDQRTCVIIKFVGDQICEMREYTDSHIYEEFLKRHRAELPKFKQRRDVGA